jgi:hypothetical protein
MCTSYVLSPTADQKNLQCHVCLQTEEVDADPKSSSVLFVKPELKFKKQVVVICKKLHKMQATVWRSSHCVKFLIGKRG